MPRKKQHPIDKYCSERELTHAEFGDVIGVTRQHVWYMTNSGDVGTKTAKAIVEATGGEISYDDLYQWEKPTRARA